jgi:hypothetical protein
MNIIWICRSFSCTKNFYVKGRNGGERKKCKQRASTTLIVINIFFGNVRPCKKSNPIQMRFIEDLVLIITKGYMPMSIVESPWLKQMVLCLCGQVQFPFWKLLGLKNLVRANLSGKILAMRLACNTKNSKPW